MANPRRPNAESILPFNPLDYANLTKNVVDELMRQGPVTLPLERRFVGAGVYALFYIGDDPEYAPQKSPDAQRPIYVGKAVPAGARKGVITNKPVVELNLHDRLAEHTASIEAAVDLSPADFLCRYLVVEPLWIVMAEQFLITNFKPLWNLELAGFGNHVPGKGRLQGEISWWDTRHQGRPWAKLLRQTRSKEQAIDRVREYHRLQNTDPSRLETLAREAVDNAEEEE